MLRNRQGLYQVECLFVAGCASTSTEMGSVSRQDLDLEAVKQQALVLQSGLDQQRRLDDVAAPLLHAAKGLCGSDVTRRAGLRFLTVSNLRDEEREPARMLGFSDSVTVVGVSAGGGAARADVRLGDRIVALGSRQFSAGTEGSKELREVLRREVDDGARTVSLTIVRTGVARVVVVPLDTVCSYGVLAVRNPDLNAFADGEAIYVTSGMMRFVNDTELATVVAHEVSHNAMGHIRKKKSNALLGGLLGFVVDIAAASQGVNTGGGEYAGDGKCRGCDLFPRLRARSRLRRHVRLGISESTV